MTAAEPPLRSPWFHSAPFDLVLLLGAPLLIWPLITLAAGATSPALLNQLILLSATGHYFATFVRAYGDRELFQRFRTRLLLTPAVLLVTCIALFSTGHTGALLLVTAGWALWHWLAQAFGFARIYDIKVGSFRPLTAWLDKLLVITGFVAAIALNDGALAEFAKAFLNAGLPLPSRAQFAVVRQFVLGAAVLVGAAYVVNLAVTIARRQPWSWQKQVMHVTTIGYYWFAFAWLPNVVLSYVLYELFHDTQYYAITWLTCRQRSKRPGVTPWFSFLFRPGFGAAVTFVLAMMAFGAIDLGGRHHTADPTLRNLSLGLFLCAALLHYYYDGFIWKARERTLGSDLGIQDGLRAAMVPGLRHASYWAAFFVPLGALLAFGHGEWTPRERCAALVELAPGDFYNQAQLGLELAKARDLDGSFAHYRAAIAANPDYAPARANFGAVLDLAGDLGGAREQYEQALRCADAGPAHAQAHINLGVLALLRGEMKEAQQHFQSGARLGGEHPIGRMLGMAAGIPQDAVQRRQQYLEAVLRLDANQVDAHLGLGGLLLVQQRHDQAASHFTAVLRTAPGYLPALLGLANAQVGIGQIEPARQLLQQVLAREPRNTEALALQARIGGR